MTSAGRRAGSARVLFGLALVAFVALGLPDGTLGVAWPSMAGDLERPISDLGVLLVAQAGGYLLVSAANGYLVARVGTGRLLAAAAAASALGLGGFAAGAGWPVLIVASIVVGMAAGAVDAGINAHVALHHSRRAMGLLHAAFGVGATAGPLLVTTLVRAELSWRVAYGVLVAAQLVLLGGFSWTRRRWQRPPPAEPMDRAGAAGPRLRTAMVTGLVAFFVYTGLELAAGQWAFSLLTEHRGVGVGVAGALVASYWGALTVGRLALAFAGHRLATRELLTRSTAGAAVGTLFLWLDPAGLGALALPFIGLCLAPIFPTLVTATPERLGAGRSTHAIGYQLAAAGVGAALLPGAVGVAVAAAGLSAIGPALVAMAVVLVVLQVTDPSARSSATPVAVVGD